MKNLEEMKKELPLKPIHIIFLANTGSMTTLLEALFGPVKIQTEIQKVIKADKKLAHILQITKGALVNHRIVKLMGGRILVHATSYAPISRLKSGFKDDIMKKDIPIGKILSKHDLETRRHILGFDWLNANDKQQQIFSIEPGGILLKRSYNIIHAQKPLINITEIFPYELVD